MRDPNTAARAIRLGFLVILTALTGCAFFPYKVDVTETGSPRFSVLDLNYKLESGRGALGSTVFRTDNQVNLVGYSGWPNPKKPNYSSAGLRIEYPHPDRNHKFARVTLRLLKKPRSSATKRRGFANRMKSGMSVVSWRGKNARNTSEAVAVVRVLDLSKSELDLLLIDLANSGFFDGQQRQSGGSQLSVRIDRGETAHPWGSEPRLDDLMARVYKEGRDAVSSELDGQTNIRGSQ